MGVGAGVSGGWVCVGGGVAVGGCVGGGGGDGSFPPLPGRREERKDEGEEAEEREKDRGGLMHARGRTSR